MKINTVTLTEALYRRADADTCQTPVWSSMRLAQTRRDDTRQGTALGKYNAEQIRLTNRRRDAFCRSPVIDSYLDDCDLTCERELTCMDLNLYYGCTGAR